MQHSTSNIQLPTFKRSSWHRLRCVLLLLLLLPAGCREAKPPATCRFPVMSTLATVSVPVADAARLPALRDQVAAAFDAVELGCSAFIAESDLATLNRQSGGEALHVNRHLAATLDAALRLARESNGALDPTVGPLMQLWGFRSETGVRTPTPEALEAIRKRIGWRKVELSGYPGETPLARLHAPEMRLDLGAIAKGYAVDEAFKLLDPQAPSFMIDLGGNLRVRGEAAPGRGGWRTGIRNPFDRNMLIGTLLLTNGEAVATSGNYERFVIIENRRYAHIMDPRTGRPVVGMAGVTVLAPSAMLADGLSTALFVLGPEAGMELLRLYPGCEALWVPDEQPPRVLATPGFHKRLEPAKDWRDRVSTVP